MKKRTVEKDKKKREKRSRGENDKLCRKIMFWNVAGVGNKGKDFWKFICKYDFISLCETWVDKEGWGKLKEKLPKTHDWECSFATKDKKNGRAKGGFIIGKKKNWGDQNTKIICKQEKGVLISEIVEGEEIKYIISVCNKECWDDLKVILDNVTEGMDGEFMLIGGDFNRIGELGGGEEEDGGVERKSKDKLVSNGGKGLIDLIQDKGWYVLNGTMVGDWDGEYTFVGARGSSVIDYVFCNKKARDFVRELSIGDRVDSDHMPMMVTLEGGGEEEGEEGKEERREEEIWKICWDKKAIQKYRESTDSIIWEHDLQGSVEDKWQKLKDIVQEALVKRKLKTVKRELGHKDWWDRQCTRKKRQVHRLYKKWRMGKERKDKFLEEKRKLKELAE
ncbi:uncharacterized protein [Temnothorax nylanderi]|uniref:uncharacterized protein n=1 Tax=Temnothorax nylanderi TaxID=102681 RepID=UPI003A84F2A9